MFAETTGGATRIFASFEPGTEIAQSDIVGDTPLEIVELPTTA